MLDRLSDDDEYDPIDKDALRRALETVLRDSGMWAEQFKARLAAGDNWLELATSAAYHLQSSTLRLPPWRSPPCAAGPQDKESEELLERMLAENISAFEPDPPRALAQAKKRQK